MNPLLLDFLYAAQLPAFLSFIAALVRVCLIRGGLKVNETYTTSFCRQSSILLGSVAVGVITDFVIHSWQSMKGWELPLAMGAAFSAQDFAMAISKRIPMVLDAFGDSLNTKLQQRNKDRNDNDNLKNS